MVSCDSKTILVRTISEAKKLYTRIVAKNNPGRHNRGTFLETRAIQDLDKVENIIKLGNQVTYRGIEWKEREQCLTQKQQTGSPILTQEHRLCITSVGHMLLMPYPMHAELQGAVTKNKQTIMTGNDVVKVAMHRAMPSTPASTAPTTTDTHNIQVHTGDAANSCSRGIGV